jgi:hypothetical protein
MTRSTLGVLLRLSPLVLVTALPACGGAESDAPAVATPSVTVSRDRAPASAPIDITYRFEVTGDAQFDRDYRVMLHVVDSDEERMWDDDHDPPVPTTQWKPGQVVEYTRTVFVPVFPYIGPASLYVGLYAPDGGRLPLNGEHVGQRAYRVGQIELLPQTENLFTVFRDGWHLAEVAGDNTLIEWQWTKKDATLAFKNPMSDVTFYLDVDCPGGGYVGPQVVTVSVGGQHVEEFTLQPHERVLRRVGISAAQLGKEEVAEILISIDKTFIPARIPEAQSKDPRELGVRVFHAFVEPRQG